MTDDNSTDYESRVAEQLEQFRNPERLIGLPASFKYWNENFIAPKIRKEFGHSSIFKVYADAFAESIAKSSSTRILSVGCGDASNEIHIAEEMIQNGVEDFVFDATELSTDRLKVAESRVAERGLEKHFNLTELDVNTWEAKPDSYAGAMAQHTLHHITCLLYTSPSPRD